MDKAELIWKTVSMYKSVLAICLGASLGAILRWLVSNWLNPVCALFPMGTLLVNVSGSLCIGLASGFFQAMPQLAPEWRLAVITGFLGALTTFSSFASEMGSLLLQHKYGAMFLGMFLHVTASISAFLLGLWIWQIMASR